MEAGRRRSPRADDASREGAHREICLTPHDNTPMARTQAGQESNRSLADGMVTRSAQKGRAKGLKGPPIGPLKGQLEGKIDQIG
jgi:hypothetical protein